MKESEVTQLCPTLCDPMDCHGVACQDPPSMGFSKQEYWSGLPFPSPGDLSDPGIKAGSLALQVDSLVSQPPGKPIKLRVQLNSSPCRHPVFPESFVKETIISPIE